MADAEVISLEDHRKALEVKDKEFETKILEQKQKAEEAAAALLEIQTVAKTQAQAQALANVGHLGDNGVPGSGLATDEKSMIRYTMRRALDGSWRREPRFVALSKQMSEFLKGAKAAAYACPKGAGVTCARSDDWAGKVDREITVGDNATAGFLIPPEWVDMIWERIFEDDWWLNNAEILPMNSDFISGNILNQLFGDSPEYDSGIDFNQSRELETQAENTNPSFRKLGLRAKKTRGIQKLSREFMDDTPFFATWFTQRLERAFRREWNRQVWEGTGSDLDWFGFSRLLAADGIHETNRATTQLFRYNDALGMEEKMSPELKELVWFMRKPTRSQILRNRTLDDLDVSAFEDVRRNPSEQGLLGFPIEISFRPAPLGGVGGDDRDDVWIAAPKAYVIGLRQGFELEVERGGKFWEDDVVAFGIRGRADGQPIWADGFGRLIEV